MTNRQSLYQNIKSELSEYQVKVKACKKARPTRSWQKLEEHREALNVVRFLNAYIYFIKYDGKKFKYNVKGCDEVGGRLGELDKYKKFELLSSNVNRFLCLFIEFYNHCGIECIKIDCTEVWRKNFPIGEYRSCFVGINKVIDIFCKIHQYDGDDKDGFFTEETKDFRKWFKEIHSK